MPFIAIVGYSQLYSNHGQELFPRLPEFEENNNKYTGLVKTNYGFNKSEIVDLLIAKYGNVKAKLTAIIPRNAVSIP